MVLSPEFGASCSGFNSDQIFCDHFCFSESLSAKRRVRGISITNILSKYNSESKVIVSASIEAPLGAASALWISDSIASFNSSDAPLSPLERTLTQGFNTFQLALQSGTLTAGMSYEFRLFASYYSFGFVALGVASVVITMNEPPRSGLLTIFHSTGFALCT